MAEFAAAVYDTVPLPEPVVPEVIVIQVAPLVADQLQLAAAETVTLLVPPAAPNEAANGVTVTLFTITALVLDTAELVEASYALA